MPKLIFLDEKFRGRVHELVEGRTTVGRSSRNLLSIRDATLSREHCEIHVYNLEVIVRDSGSRNGTFVNGLRLYRGQAQLKHGQIVSFGGLQARLELESPEPDEFASTALHDFRKYREQQQRLGDGVGNRAPANSAALDEAQIEAGADRTMTLNAFRPEGSSAREPLRNPERPRPGILSLFRLRR